MKRYEVETRGAYLLIHFYKAPSHLVSEMLKSKGYKFYNATKQWVGRKQHEDFVLDTIEAWSARCDRQNVKTTHAQTLCVKCANSGHGCTSPCSWEREFKPVEGWKAIRQDIKVHDEEMTESYVVLECPQFRHMRRKRHV